MCGILGYIRPRQAVNVLLPALKRLEYRGCDSAGIATANGKTLDIRKTVGKLASLEAFVEENPPRGDADQPRNVAENVTVE